MMLESLANTSAQQLQMEPISAYPNKLREQIADNKAIMEDMDRKSRNIELLKLTANDLLKQAGSEDENSKGFGTLVCSNYYTYEFCVFIFYI